MSTRAPGNPDTGVSDEFDIVIVVPHTGHVSMRWAVRLATLELPPHYIVTKSTGAIDLAREQTIEDALEHDPEWLLFLDSDVIPPLDVFQRLRRHGRDIVSGLYYVDGDFVHPAMWVLDENDSPSSVDFDGQGNMLYGDTHSPSKAPIGEDGLVSVDAIGLGCLLVHRRLIDDVERPWFRWTKGYDQHPWDLKHAGERFGVSEDFYFCHKVQEAGYDIHVDTTVQCAHEKGCVLTAEGVFLESQL